MIDDRIYLFVLIYLYILVEIDVCLQLRVMCDTDMQEDPYNILAFTEKLGVKKKKKNFHPFHDPFSNLALNPQSCSQLLLTTCVTLLLLTRIHAETVDK